jgi:p25-alpha
MCQAPFRLWVIVPVAGAQGLQEKFLAFAAYGSKKSETQLDGRSYVKLFKDAGLLKKPLTTTDLV